MVSKKMASPVGFGITGITALLDLAQNVKDQNGDPIVVTPDTVIYNPSNITKAIQIFGSALEPFTADNQDNAIPKRMPRAKHIVKRYVTDSASYMLMDSSENDAWFLVRRAVEFDDTFDFDTDAAKYKVTTRFLIWFVKWWSWFGVFPS